MDSDKVTDLTESASASESSAGQLVQSMGELVIADKNQEVAATELASGRSDGGSRLIMPNFPFSPEYDDWHPNPTNITQGSSSSGAALHSTEIPGIIVYRMLLSCSRASRVIGSRGNLINSISNAHQCRFIVTEAPNWHDRMIVISANSRPDLAEDRAEQALLRVHKIAYPASEKYGFFAPTRLLARKAHAYSIMESSSADIQRLMESTQANIEFRDDTRPFALPEDAIIEIFGCQWDMREIILFMAKRLKTFRFDSSMVSLFYLCPDPELNNRWRRHFNLEPVGPSDVYFHGGIATIRGLPNSLEYLSSLIRTKFPEVEINFSADDMGDFISILGPKAKLEDLRQFCQETVDQVGADMY